MEARRRQPGGESKPVEEPTSADLHSTDGGPGRKRSPSVEPTAREEDGAGGSSIGSGAKRFKVSRLVGDPSLASAYFLGCPRMCGVEQDWE